MNLKLIAFFKFTFVATVNAATGSTLIYPSSIFCAEPNLPPILNECGEIDLSVTYAGTNAIAGANIIINNGQTATFYNQKGCEGQSFLVNGSNDGCVDFIDMGFTPMCLIIDC